MKGTTPQKKEKGDEMNVGQNSPEFQAYLEQCCDNMQRRIKTLRENPVTFESLAIDRPHVLAYFERIAAMTREELLKEIEADCLLFLNCNPGPAPL